MPTYDYACPACGPFEALRRLDARDLPSPCPECGAASDRMLAHAPQLALMDGATRTAMLVNERASHAPRSSRDAPAPHRHHAGCGCAHKRGATVTGANGNKAFPGKRPWMISH